MAKQYFDGNKLKAALARRPRLSRDQILESPKLKRLLVESMKSLREFTGLTQDEVAQKARIHRSKLSLFENGLADLTAEEEARVEKILKSHKGPKAPRLELHEMLTGDYDVKAMAERFAAWQDQLATRRKKESPRLLRKQAGMSQREIARASQIPRNKIIEWEAGRIELSAEERTRWEAAIHAASSRKRRFSVPWFQDVNLLRTRREELGLSRLELAKMAGVEHTILVNIEEGQQELTEEIAEPIWEAISAVSIARRRELSPEDQVALHERLRKGREEEAERKRQLLALENLRSIEDPIVSELIESFRREIAYKNEQLAELQSKLQFQSSLAADLR